MKLLAISHITKSYFNENMSINLKSANSTDLDIVVDIDDLKRADLWKKAIAKEECFLVLDEAEIVGFVVFNYSFFGHGWLDMIEIREKSRRKGIGEKAINLVMKMCKTEKFFTSTNKSNTPMRNLLTKMDFVYSGILEGLDEGDPEIFYYKKLNPA